MGQKFYIQETPCSPLVFFSCLSSKWWHTRKVTTAFCYLSGSRASLGWWEELDKPPQTKEHPAGSLCHPPLPQTPVQLPLPAHRAGPAPLLPPFCFFFRFCIAAHDRADRISHPESHTLLQHQRAAGDEWQWWQLLRGRGKGQHTHIRQHFQLWHVVIKQISCLHTLYNLSVAWLF